LTAVSEIPHRSLAVAAVVALRPRQWLKNVLVFAAPLAAGSIFQPDVLLPSVIAFIAFCLISSSTYIINDLRDLSADQQHPTKRARPIPAGQLPRTAAIIEAIVLALVSIAISASVRPALAAVVIVYFIFTLAYSMFLKHEPVIELALLAMGFLLRAIAGGVASDLPISQWFLIVAGFGSLFMAAGKRASELQAANAAGEGTAAIQRKSLAGYSPGYLRFVWGTAAAVTITAYCLWAFDVANQESSLPWAEWSIVPFVLAILRYAVVIDNGRGEVPEDAVLRDHVLQILGLAWIILFGLGALGV
jgi:decaprenyl-phosphate phosphoribosyltransferase